MPFSVGEKPQVGNCFYAFGDTWPWSASCTHISMLTQTPTGLLVENRAKVTATLAEQLLRNRYVGQFRTLGPFELRAMIDRILDYYGKWSGGDLRELAACLDFLENICFAMSIPLAETAYALYVLRDGIQDIFTPGTKNANSETIEQVNKFFEALVRDLLRRY